MEYYSVIKRNKTESFVVMWMNLESVIHNEVKPEREKQILYINANEMESRKIVLMNLFAGQDKRGRHGEQTCEHSRGRRGWGKLRE